MERRDRLSITRVGKSLSFSRHHPFEQRIKRSNGREAAAESTEFDLRNHLAGYDDWERYENLARLAKRLFRYDRMSRRDAQDAENWTGRWMPDRPNDPTPSPKVWPKNKQRHDNEYESATELPSVMHHNLLQPHCDDGKVSVERFFRYRVTNLERPEYL